METFLLYLLKSSGIIALFLLFYVLFLKRETFFHANRIFLLAGLGFSIIVPFMVFTKIIWLQPMPMYQIQISDQLGVAPANENPIDWTLLILYGYCTGVFLFSIRFVVQLLSLKRLIRNGKKIREGKFVRIETDQKGSPFSFFTHLVYNPELHTSSELRTILAHEKVHAQERHSLDILAVQLFTIFQWCNPFVWWYRTCVNDNLEYVADTETTAQNTDKTEYQYLLLQTGMGEKHYSVATPFFNNSIKKRIVMLNKIRSNRKNSFKYALMPPLLAGFIFLFNVKTEAQVKSMDSIQGDTNKYGPVTFDKERSGDFPNINLSKGNHDLHMETDELIYPGSDGHFSVYLGGQGALYMIDGKEVSKTEFEKIDPNWIKSVYVWKGEAAIDRFGDKGKNGVQEIILKKDYLSIPKTKDTDDPKVMPSAIIVQDPIDEKTFAAAKAAAKASGTSISNIEKDPLIILDGKEVPYNIIDSLTPESIERVSVWKGQQAIDRYGEKGKNGVIEIALKKDYLDIPKTKYSDSLKIRSSTLIIHDSIDGSPLVTGKASGIRVSPENKGQLLILDGKEVPYSKINSLTPESIESMNVWKGQQAIEKYGDKAKNGVIVIVTKKE